MFVVVVADQLQEVEHLELELAEREELVRLVPVLACHLVAVAKLKSLVAVANPVHLMVRLGAAWAKLAVRPVQEPVHCHAEH